MINTHHYFLTGHQGGHGSLKAEYMIVFRTVAKNRSPEEYLKVASEKSLSIIRAIAKKCGIPSSSLYFTAFLKDKVGKVTVAREDITRNYSEFLSEVALIKPRKILVFGGDITSFLIPDYENLLEDHGTIFPSKALNALVVPTFEFSSASKNPELWEMINRDITRFFTIELTSQTPYRIIKESDLEIVEGKHEYAYVDVETTGVGLKDTITKVGLWFSGFDDPTVYIIENPTKSDLVSLGSKLGRIPIQVGHNYAFDLVQFLTSTDGLFPVPLRVHDTMLMAHNVGHNKLSLKHLTSLLTDLPGSRSGGGIQDNQYLAEDIASTRCLHETLLPQTRDRYIFGLSQTLVGYISTMRYNGVHIDTSALKEVEEFCKEEVKNSMMALESFGGHQVNWNSPKQVVEFLLSQGVVLTEKTESGTYSVSEMVLNKLAEQSIPVIKPILALRASMKQLQFVKSYYGFLEEYDGKLHPRLLLQGTVTGRLSCRDPNLQQVPREGPIKKMFNSRYEGGFIGLIDLSQAELRIAALLSGDAVLAKNLLAGDAHLENASIVFEKPKDQITPTERKASKKTTFGVLYGGSAKGLASRNELDPALVTLIIKKMEKGFPSLMKWIRDTHKVALTELELTSLFGRTREFRTLIKIEGEAGVKRKATNTPIQSLASDCSLVIMNQVNTSIRERGLKSLVLFTVHDSTILDIHPDEVGIIPDLIQEGFEALWKTPLSKVKLFADLPLVGELVIGKTWASVESTNQLYDPINSFPCSSHGRGDE